MAGKKVYVCKMCGAVLPSLDSLLYHFWSLKDHQPYYNVACVSVGAKPSEPRRKRWKVYNVLKDRGLVEMRKATPQDLARIEELVREMEVVP